MDSGSASRVADGPLPSGEGTTENGFEGIRTDDCEGIRTEDG